MSCVRALLSVFIFFFSRVTINKSIVTLVALRMVEMAIWFFLATVVVFVTALLGFLVLRKGSKLTKNECLGLRTGNVLGDGFGEGRAWKGKDPPVFSGRPLEFSEWQFAIEEALAVVPPADQVWFAVSYRGGDARRWFMTAYPDGERPNDWTPLWNGLRAAFSPDGERAFHRTKLLRIRQVGSLENYIVEFRSICISSSEVDELTKAILFTEGLKVELRRAVKQAQAETLQTAVRAARAAMECEPELIEQDNSSSSPLYARRVTSARTSSLAGLRRLPPCVNVRILSVVSTVHAWVT